MRLAAAAAFVAHASAVGQRVGQHVGNASIECDSCVHWSVTTPMPYPAPHNIVGGSSCSVSAALDSFCTESAFKSRCCRGSIASSALVRLVS